VTQKLVLGFSVLGLFIIVIAGIALSYLGRLLGALPAWLFLPPAVLLGLVVVLALFLYRSVATPVRQIVEQAIIDQVGLSLSSTLDLEQVVWTIYRQVGQVFDTSGFYVALYDQERREWETVLDVMLGEIQTPVCHSVDEGLTGYIIRNRRPLLFRNNEEVRRFQAEQGIDLIGLDSQSWMGVPMIAGDRVVGAIGVESYDQERAFDRSDLQLVSAAASCAAIAVENARVYQKSQLRLKELNSLFEVASRFLSTVNLQEILEAVCREAVRLLDATSAYIEEWVEQGHSTRVVAEFHGEEASSKERVSDMGVVYEGQEYLAQLMKDGQSYVLKMDDPMLPRSELESFQGARSVLYLPLVARGRTYGFLGVWESRYERSFVEEEILLGRNLASQAAIAIENSLLLQAVEQTVKDLTSASEEILTATTQQASGATEQTSAISQVSSTIDQVRSISARTAQRAQTVADLSKHTAEISQAGEKTVSDTIVGMVDVKQKVESIATGILALSEQAQAIGQIVATVNEIADQSNMLALNAAVEAHRAGEAGRGFAVVAQEVRSLAEQSRIATEQVDGILTEIQRGINSAVMATEEGMKGTDVGMKLARGAGQVIRELAERVLESTQSAVQIASAANQQLTGMEQVSETMDHIHLATSQSATSAQLVERAAADLNALAGRLRDLVGHYAS
jgi:GAF domain-containing protein